MGSGSLDAGGGGPTTSLSATKSGNGYRFTSRGGVLTFGDGPFPGDVSNLSNLSLAGPVLDSIPTPTGVRTHVPDSDGAGRRSHARAGSGGGGVTSPSRPASSAEQNCPLEATQGRPASPGPPSVHLEAEHTELRSKVRHLQSVRSGGRRGWSHHGR